jgi:two-component system phosphate regulon sensor histidine kinase PhoR
MPFFRSIRWKLTLGYLITVLISISLLGLYLSHWTSDRYATSLRHELESESHFIGHVCEKPFPTGIDSLDALTRQMGANLHRRVTIVALDGTVKADSMGATTLAESDGSLPSDVTDALEEGMGYSIQMGSGRSSNILYVATSFGPDKIRPLGAVRVSESLAQIDLRTRQINQVFFLAAFLAFIVAAIVGAKISDSITAPILAMNRIAGRFAAGDLSQRLDVREVPANEIDELARTLNMMAFELRSMMHELAEEKVKLEAIFAKTDDGLVVVDQQARIRLINPAASQILGLNPAQVVGKTIIESTLHHDLSELADRVLRTGKPASLEIQISMPSEKYLNIYVSPLERPSGPAGAVLVIHNLTATRQIDLVRRDFVANVSHELRTPLASIKAMAETILLRGKTDPEVGLGFAEKIQTQADRLTALSEDLLDLAKIEAGRDIRAEKFDFFDLSTKVVTEVIPLALRRNIDIFNNIQPDTMVNADPDAAYQVIGNLVDNAIKYTPAGGKVTLNAEINTQWVAITVSDTGIGIPQGDLSRIFERFYRVDKARSRDSGGTGLGLSIVKHLVESHGGKVTVESTPNKGTSFTFTLPIG